MSSQWMQWLLRTGLDMSNNNQSRPPPQPQYPEQYRPFDPFDPHPNQSNFNQPLYKREGGNESESNPNGWNSLKIFGLDRFLFVIILILIVVGLAIRIFYNQNHRISALEKRNKYLVTHRQLQTYANNLPNEDNDDDEFMGMNQDENFDNSQDDMDSQQERHRNHQRHPAAKRTYSYDDPNHRSDDEDLHL